MRLELGTFPVDEIAFGPETRWRDGRLEIDRERILAEVRTDARLRRVELELARPGESVRIWPVRDVIEPRVKVDGPGVAYPAIVGRNVTTVGRGRTHRLANVGVAEVADVPWHNAGGDYLDVFLDMVGPWSEVIPTSKLLNVCLVAEPEPGVDVDEQNYAVHAATLAVADHLARAVADLDPPQLDTYELPPAPDLPGVVYFQFLHSPQAKAQSLKTFTTGIYGLSQLTPPWVLHPNEVLDGAINGPYRGPFANSWTVINNPLLLELYRRHGTEIDFKAVIALRTEWTTQREKELMAGQAAKAAKMLGARGAVLTWDAGGNELLEVMYTVRDCERDGIKTVFMTSEDRPDGGASTLLEHPPEADAIVSTGYYLASRLGLDPFPAVDRVIGSPIRKVRRDSNGTVIVDDGEPVNGPLTPPWRYDDHYGFSTLSVFTY